jgi:hypothetical protein
MRWTIVVAGAVLLSFAAAQNRGTREISRADLRDKIEGGWAGQMIGVSFGAPTEFRYREQIIEGDLPAWTPDRIKNSLNQDDLYVDMTFAKVLDDKGINATSDDFGAMFRDAKYSLWHANLAARRALRRGVKGSQSGLPKYNAHANDIDFQIEADFIGLMTPGLLQSSNDIAMRAGRVMNYGDGIYGGMFVSGMYAAAFFESDPRRIVEQGLACIPAKSPYGLLIADVLEWSRQHRDWKKVWQLIEDKWNKREPCPAGAMRPFNIDAKLNGAYIALGMLFGGGDFGKTLEISTRAGQDSDCNPASACGVLGVMLGYKRIPDEWKSGIPAIAGEKFRYTDFSFKTIVDSTEKRALDLIRQTGGRADGEKISVKLQTPKAPKLEIWDDYGSPAERIGTRDPRWAFKGNWSANPMKSREAEIVLRKTDEKGAEATVTFEGTGAIISGQYMPAGGKANVYLDGKLHQSIDSYSDESATKSNEAVWHVFGLRNGKHTVRLVVLGEPFAESKGSDVSIEDLIVFR